MIFDRIKYFFLYINLKFTNKEFRSYNKGALHINQICFKLIKFFKLNLFFKKIDNYITIRLKNFFYNMVRAHL